MATWAVMVTVPAADGESAQVTALAAAVGSALAGWLGKLVAILLAAFFLFITVVYNFSFARLIFVSGLDQTLPAAMAKVNKNKVPSNAVWVQTVIASLFALAAFIVLPSLGVGGGAPIDIQTKVYDVLQAAVTVIWCISMVVLFVDVIIIIRRFLPRYEETRLARPAVFYTCAVVGRRVRVRCGDRDAQRLVDAIDRQRLRRDRLRRRDDRLRSVVLSCRGIALLSLLASSGERRWESTGLAGPHRRKPLAARSSASR